MLFIFILSQHTRVLQVVLMFGDSTLIAYCYVMRACSRPASLNLISSTRELFKVALEGIQLISDNSTILDGNGG